MDWLGKPDSALSVFIHFLSEGILPHGQRLEAEREAEHDVIERVYIEFIVIVSHKVDLHECL